MCHCCLLLSPFLSLQLRLASILLPLLITGCLFLNYKLFFPVPQVAKKENFFLHSFVRFHFLPFITIYLLFSPATIPNSLSLFLYVDVTTVRWKHTKNIYLQNKTKQTKNYENLYLNIVLNPIKNPKTATIRQTCEMKSPNWIILHCCVGTARIVTSSSSSSSSTETERQRRRRQATLGFEENLLGINKYHCTEGKCSSFCAFTFLAVLFLVLFVSFWVRFTQSSSHQKPFIFRFHV